MMSLIRESEINSRTNVLWMWNEKVQEFPPFMPDGKPWPKISVVTPSFNQGKYIEETIRSVIMQGYPNLEYIIIDGGSTDNTVDIIKKYQNYITYWISEKDKGQTHAINKGFDKASGEILAYINSDDVYMPYTFRLVAELFKKFKIHWLTGIQSRLVEHNVISPKRDAVKLFNQYLYKNGYHVGSLFGWNQQCSTFWSSELFFKVGRRFDEKFNHAMDIDMWIRMSNFSELISVEAILALMRLHPDQKSRNINIAEIEINRKSDAYRLSNYALRKTVFHLYKVPLIRKFLKLFWCRGDGKYIIWNARNSEWEMATGYVRV
ncbi:MAG: glycosyltransferase [Flavobacteriales bacterium]|nr:glycosyltransferase [Flavobacteriales bacterium]